jgi:hypothetical protein
MIYSYFSLLWMIYKLFFIYILKIDEEDYGGQTELFKEGLISSFASFMVSFFTKEEEISTS